DARRTLDEELGIEPGPALKELERGILNQEPALRAAVARPPTPAPAVVSVPVEPARPRETRRLVTVLFCDLVESTALAETIDPEVLRRLLERYFDAAATVIRRHEGTVEKFIGDAVFAVFGVPIAHEDDALRAARAALDLRAR